MNGEYALRRTFALLDVKRAHCNRVLHGRSTLRNWIADYKGFRCRGNALVVRRVLVRARELRRLRP
jgi:hypothetical protein